MQSGDPSNVLSGTVAGDLVDNPSGHHSCCPQICPFLEHAPEQLPSLVVDVTHPGKVDAELLMVSATPRLEPALLQLLDPDARQSAFDPQLQRGVPLN